MIKNVLYLTKTGYLAFLRQKRESSLLLFTLALGFLALTISLGVRDSQNNLVTVKAREILTGDAQLSSTRPISTEEAAVFEAKFPIQKRSIETDVLATIRFQDHAFLSELKAVTDSFPLIGRVEIDNESKQNSIALKRGEIWLAKELEKLTQLKKGDLVQVGEHQFRLAGWITADLGLRRGATGFAPRAYIRSEDLEPTQLIQPGSQVQYRITYLLKEIPANRIQIDNWSEEIIIRWPEDAISGLKRGISVVERYLNTITLFLMLLGFVSGFYLLQIHLRRRALEWGLHLILGARPLSVEVAAVVQIFTLLFLAAGIGLSLTLLLFAFLNTRIEDIFPLGARLLIGQQGLWFCFAVVAINSFVFSLPFVLRLRRFDPNSLLNSSQPEIPHSSFRNDLLPYALALSAYCGVASWLLDSWSMAIGMVGVVLVLVALSAWALPAIAKRLALNHFFGKSRVVWLNLGHPRLLMTLIWVALAWSALMVATIPNVLKVAKQEISSPSRQDLPQIFVINIVPDDLSPLSTTVSSLGGELRYASPLILGRLKKVNGQPIQEGRLARFPVRLTYRNELTAAELVVAGESTWPPPKKSGLNGVSIEKEFAERENLKLNDKLEFEVAGLPVEAYVHSLRQVKWNTFQPNFFIQFPQGVIDDFPQSYLAVIYNIPAEQLLAAQSSLSRKFPNLSLLNLATTLQRLAELADKLYLPIVSISLFGCFIALGLISMMSLHLWKERDPERQLFHYLGTQSFKIRRLFSLESLIWSGSSLSLGLVLGYSMTVLAGWRIFERWLWPTAWIEPLGLVAIALGLALYPSIAASLGIRSGSSTS